MSKIHTKFIDYTFGSFAPSILDGQVITAYIGENITPYTIQGENFSSLQSLVALLNEQINSLQSSSS